MTKTISFEKLLFLMLGIILATSCSNDIDSPEVPEGTRSLSHMVTTPFENFGLYHNEIMAETPKQFESKAYVEPSTLDEALSLVVKSECDAIDASLVRDEEKESLKEYSFIYKPLLIEENIKRLTCARTKSEFELQLPNGTKIAPIEELLKDATKRGALTPTEYQLLKSLLTTLRGAMNEELSMAQMAANINVIAQEWKERYGDKLADIPSTQSEGLVTGLAIPHSFSEDGDGVLSGICLQITMHSGQFWMSNPELIEGGTPQDTRCFGS